MPGSRMVARGISVSQDGRLFDEVSGVELIPVPRLEDGTTYWWCVEADEYVHRLVAEAWIPRPAGMTEVLHRDGNGENNRTTNLRWTSIDEYRDELERRLHDHDLDRMEKTFRHDESKAQRRRNPLLPKNMKVTPQQVRAIRRAARAGASHRSQAQKYGVIPLTIFNIVHRRSWSWIPDDDVVEADPDLEPDSVAEEEDHVESPF